MKDQLRVIRVGISSARRDFEPVLKAQPNIECGWLTETNERKEDVEEASFDIL